MIKGSRKLTLSLSWPDFLFGYPLGLYHFTYSLPPIHFSPSILLGWNFDSRTRKMRVYWLENFNSDESRLSKSSDKFSPISDPMTHANWLLPRKVRKREGKIIRHFSVTGCWNYGVLYSRAYNTHISYLIYFHDKKECWVIVINLLNSPLYPEVVVPRMKGINVCL